VRLSRSLRTLLSPFYVNYVSKVMGENISVDAGYLYAKSGLDIFYHVSVTVFF